MDFVLALAPGAVVDNGIGGYCEKVVENGRSFSVGFCAAECVGRGDFLWEV